MSRLRAVVMILSMRARDSIELTAALLVALTILEAGGSAARAISVAMQPREVGQS